ncbi:nitroreductase family protein [Acinetobacter qingfengensis]|uniref:Nitroreductase n=1 Tax=Acinetobacter qingfengensis TaxID=1262585 RepID=A0A1E7RFL1_9GAMM|nr:nitroreductase family protein [Acinetobacter qingfengensis]KAA8735605.1 nitroreductase family protein [Acinetobacter qingfengensis]OEY97945.1 nitroreductase [Acinetobacter qingfengensis]
MSFIDQLKQRRTIYAIGKNVQQSPEQLNELIHTAIKYAPSSFNSQSSRAVTLFGESHTNFWEIVRETLRKLVPPEAFASTDNKINSFSAGFATVLFYEDQSVITGLQEQFPAYAENFPIWSEHSTAMAQLAVWTALSEIHVGASLQHYNPIIDAEVAQTFEIPATWKLRAQLVLGSIEAPAGEKTFIDDTIRFKTFA